MSKKAEKTESVAMILFEDWDPIGLKSLGAPNQYNRYAREIVSQFSGSPKEDEIFDYLKHACQKRMGLGLNNPDWSATRTIAEKIALLLDHES